MGLLYDLLQGQLDDINIKFKDSDTTNAEDDNAADVSDVSSNTAEIETEIEVILSNH